MPKPLFGGCRIVICGLTGQYIDQIGGNGAALKDGAFDSAAFNRPQGLAFSSKRGCLYVADTENHALREVSATVLHQLHLWYDQPFDRSAQQSQWRPVAHVSAERPVSAG